MKTHDEMVRNWMLSRAAMSTIKSDIILIGPVRAGKSTLGKLLSERLGRPQVALDDLRWKYYREIGYDDKLAKTIRQQGGLLALVLYWQLFDAYAIERILAEHHDCIFDFGAGAVTLESHENLARVRLALAPYPNVVLVLPSPDTEETLEILKARDVPPPADLNFDFNRHFLERGFYQGLARHTVYTRGKLPEETRDEILGLLASRIIHGAPYESLEALGDEALVVGMVQSCVSYSITPAG